VKTRPNDIEELIASYLVGEATPGQAHRVESWRDESEENRKYFEELRLIFEKAGGQRELHQFDADIAWKNLRAKLKNKGKSVPMQPERDYRYLLRIAAGLVLLVVAGVFTYQYFKLRSNRFVEVMAENKTKTDTLPDGSGVFLNRQTKIEYQFDRKKKTHRAKLVGEAYFNINHEDTKTFIVETSGVLIKDIGTSFNVKAYPDSPTVEVVVEEGEVMFYSEGNPGIYLQANGKGIYNKKAKTFTISHPEPNVTAYKTRFFSFSDNNLTTVVETLNEVYPQKIFINEEVKNCRITVSFNNETVGEIANVIAETLGLTVKKSGDTYTLEGSGCANGKP
jgi:transmembrane sensor